MQDQLKQSIGNNGDSQEESIEFSARKLVEIKDALLQIKKDKYLAEEGNSKDKTSSSSSKPFAIIPCDDSYIYEALWLSNLSEEGW